MHPGPVPLISTQVSNVQLTIIAHIFAVLIHAHVTVSVARSVVQLSDHELSMVSNDCSINILI